jgi:hypothetical protein
MDGKEEPWASHVLLWLPLSLFGKGDRHAASDPQSSVSHRKNLLNLLTAVPD